MSFFLTHCWRALSGWPLRERIGSHEVAVAAGANESAVRDAATRAEQLECIAVYARAGYFDMGNTADAFQLAADAPLH